jgi:ABC-2 type transport system permease protein
MTTHTRDDRQDRRGPRTDSLVAAPAALRALDTGTEGAESVRAARAVGGVIGAVRVPSAGAGLRAGLALIARSASRSWRPLVAVCFVLMLLQVALVLNASAQMEQQTFSRLAEMVPAFLRRTLGDLTVVMLSFQGIVTVGFFHPVFVLLVSLLGIYFGSEPAYNVESGFVDLLLARPLRRHWLITRSLMLILIGTCVPPLVMALTMPVALYAIAPADAPWPAAVGVLKLGMNLAAVSTVNGALSLLVASRARRRGTAMSVAGIAAVFWYVVTFLEPTWRPMQAIGWLSPFHYFHPLNVLAGREEPWRDLLVLGSLTATLAVIAYWQFARRDL